jgi:hypothetical protein
MDCAAGVTFDSKLKECICSNFYFLKERDESGNLLPSKQCAQCDAVAWQGPKERIVRECQSCPVRGQVYIDGNPFTCKCSPNVVPGFTTAGDTCMETPQVNASVDGISFDINSIYSPIQAKQITYDKEAYNAQTNEWNVNSQQD